MGRPPEGGRKGPLADSYPSAVGLVVFSLIPYLALSGAVVPLARTIGRSLGAAPSAMDLTIALSTGAYSAGTVLGVQFALHLPARRMLVIYEAIFVVASVLAASAPDVEVFMAAFIVQGLCTSLMLIAAVPALVTSWHLCIFGTVRGASAPAARTGDPGPGHRGPGPRALRRGAALTPPIQFPARCGG